MLELNRDVYKGEEILVHYDFSPVDAEAIEAAISWLQENDNLNSESEEEVTPAAAEQVAEEVTSAAEAPAAAEPSATDATDSPPAAPAAKFQNSRPAAPTQDCGECGRPVEKATNVMFAILGCMYFVGTILVMLMVRRNCEDARGMMLHSRNRAVQKRRMSQ